MGRSSKALAQLLPKVTPAGTTAASDKVPDILEAIAANYQGGGGGGLPPIEEGDEGKFLVASETDGAFWQYNEIEPKRLYVIGALPWTSSSTYISWLQSLDAAADDEVLTLWRKAMYDSIGLMFCLKGKGTGGFYDDRPCTMPCTCINGSPSVPAPQSTKPIIAIGDNPQTLTAENAIMYDKDSGTWLPYSE